MICKTIATCILVGLAVAASCCNARLPAIDYIDTTYLARARMETPGQMLAYYFRNPHEEIKLYDLRTLGQLIEDYGGDNAQETFSTLILLGVQLDDQASEGWLRVDSFTSVARFRPEESKRIANILGGFIDLIDHKPDIRSNFRERLDDFFNTIKLFFEDDLVAFVSGEPTHHKKLYVFLRHYSVRILRKWIPDAYNDPNYDHTIRRSIEKAIAYDLSPDYTDDQLIRKAEEMDLTKNQFDPKAMSERFEKIPKGIELFTPAWQPLKLLETYCWEIYREDWLEYQIYTWTRLLEPRALERMKSDPRHHLKRVEMMRVCMPVINEKKHKFVLANIERNMHAEPLIQIAPAQYIDVTFIDANLEDLTALGDLIEDQDCKTPEETLSKLEDIRVPLETGGYINSHLNGILNLINQKVKGPDFSEFSLHKFLDIIKLFFGNELEAFVSGEPTHHRKLYAFLRHYAPKILSYWIKDAFNVQMDRSVRFDQLRLEKSITYDLQPDYTEAQMIRKAQELDLESSRFDVMKMHLALEHLRSLEFKLRDRTRLFLDIFGRVCGKIYKRDWLDYQIYTWTRLLEPEELTKAQGLTREFIKRVEMVRFCLPIINRRRHESVIANVNRNLQPDGESSSQSAEVSSKRPLDQSDDDLEPASTKPKLSD